MLNTFFLLRIYNFWCLCDQLPVKILGTESLVSLPGRQQFTWVATTLQGELSMSCVITVGEDVLEACS